MKIPRFTFEKFPQTSPELGTQMKSVGEVMSIGSNFKEALGKALRSLEVDTCGFDDFSTDKKFDIGRALFKQSKEALVFRKCIQTRNEYR